LITAGHGKVVSLHIQGRSNVSAIDLFNFSGEVQQSILHAPLTSLREVYRTLGSKAPAAIDGAGEPAQPREPFFATMEQLKEVFAQGFDRYAIACIFRAGACVVHT
jgi:hypothetical protein